MVSPEEIAALRTYRRAYARLHDFVSDMVEGGRLNEENVPDDYQAVVAVLVDCVSADHVAKSTLDRLTGKAGG